MKAAYAAVLLSLSACAVPTRTGAPPPAPPPLETRLRNADTFLEEDRIASAIQELSAAQRLAGEDGPARVRVLEALGRAQLAQRDYEQAEDSFTKGIALAGALGIQGDLRAKLHHGLGLCRLRKSKFALAVRSFEEGAASEPAPETRNNIDKELARSRLEVGLSRGDVMPVPGAAPARIRSIRFHGNRTDEALLRRRLPIKEGDALPQEGLRRTREALFRMQLFKKVAISSSPAGPGEADVDIYLRDGWYLVPFPFFASGGGGSRGGMFLAGRNVFRQSESFFAMGMAGRKGARASLGGSWDGWSSELSYDKRQSSERAFADGGFTASEGFGGAADDKPKFGPVLGSALKDEKRGSVELGVPLPGKYGARLGWEYYQVRYSSQIAVPPPDAGRQSRVEFGLSAGGGDGTASAGGADMGAIFGYGLADIEERIKPLAAPRSSVRGSVRYVHAGPPTGSDFFYRAVHAKGGVSVSWGRRQRLSFNVAGGRGWGLPPAQLLSTGEVLEGSYAREFRGHSVAGAGLHYSHPFRITKRGLWQGIAFAEGGLALDGDERRNKRGFGLGFWYRFWRFPLPLGLIYNYSLDDKDAQVTAALGGRF